MVCIMGRRSKRARHLAALASAKRSKREGEQENGQDSSEDDDSIEIEVEKIDDMDGADASMPGTSLEVALGLATATEQRS